MDGNEKATELNTPLSQEFTWCGIIYKITNLINDKIYIGQTKNSIKKRFNQHIYCTNKTVITTAIKKYGKENFKIEQIDQADNESELDEKERYWIDEFKCISPNGYNIATGGKSGFDIAKEIKEKMSSPLKGRKLSEEEKAYQREIRKNKFYEDVWKGAANSGPRTGKYKGVYFDKLYNCWCARLQYKDKCYNLGKYDLEEDAAHARDLGVILYRNGEGYLNFPNDIDYNIFDKKRKLWRDICNEKKQTN